MYLSDKIKNSISEKRRDLITSYGTLNGIFIGLNTGGLVNSYDTYKRRVTNALKSLPAKYLDDIDGAEISAAESYFNDNKIPEMIQAFGIELNRLVEGDASESSSLVVRKLQIPPIQPPSYSGT
jgi:hypothetical protein